MDQLTASFHSGGHMRSRNVSAGLLAAVLDVPDPPARLLADWQWEVTRQPGLEPGDIEPLPLARTRLRWRELQHCIDAVGQWLQAQGLPEVLASSDLSLMASRGTPYHHDGARYGGKAFCNLFLGEDGGTDLHFPAAGQRIALVRGTAVLFDPCQPHAIIRRGAAGFDAADFAPEAMRPQVFLTWELPIELDTVHRALGIAFDTHPATSRQLPEEGVRRDGAPVRLCPKTGAWLDQA